jgi:hypothetical protein
MFYGKRTEKRGDIIPVFTGGIFLMHRGVGLNVQSGLLEAARIVRDLQLDLKGLNVLTECASGPYAFTPVMCCMAGARVFAVGRDSVYGRFNSNRRRLRSILRQIGALDQCQVDRTVPDKIWRQADIVTNLGFVRPISREKILLMKQTAIVALMFESSEFRGHDVDLQACRQNKVAVVGTNEKSALINFYPYIGMMALKLLFSLGSAIHRNEIALLGSRFIGSSIAKTFEALGLGFDWFTSTGRERRKRCYPYEELQRLLNKERLDAVICAELWDQRVLIGRRAAVTFAALKRRHPAVCWGHISGRIDDRDLTGSGISFSPKRIAAPHYMSYQLADLGQKPVLELNAVGLKAAELVNRARKSGLSVFQAVRIAVQRGIGQRVL